MKYESMSSDDYILFAIIALSAEICKPLLLKAIRHAYQSVNWLS